MSERADVVPLNWSELGVSELPTGTVTLLLADVEGSTRLWENQPDQMAAAVGRLDNEATEIIVAHGGVRPVEQGEGDSFVAAFARASDAVACALDLQRAPFAPMKLRIGVHTGEVHLRDDANYAGPTINRTARLRDLAHGGQTVISGATEPLVVDHLPDAAWLTDLGTHQLRDLPRPERVVQICHPDLRNAFPPLRTAKTGASHNLPARLTNFIGRQAEMHAVRQIVTENRVITLTGAGGVGKTRLAVEVTAALAAEFPDGVWFIDLAPITDPLVVSATTARTLGLPDQPGRSTIDTLLAFLGDRETLLLLDNCEHLLDACGQMIAELLNACPQLTILTTSREPIGIAGELTWRVPSLSLADEAIELFTDRARRARPDFTAADDNAALVAEICRRLDGMPLAIELAAARVRALTLVQIGDSLHDRFRLLTGGARTAVRRQQTLRASVDWSHTLLTEPERVLFRRLAVFMSGFDFDAAQAVGTIADVERYQLLDQLSLLVDKSLVVAEDVRGVMRYRLLETVRQYALEKLGESGEADAVRTRHRNHYASIAARLDTTKHASYVELIEWAELEIDNLRAAFTWSLENSEVDSALQITSALQPFWQTRGQVLEGLAWFNTGIADVHPEVAPSVRARALADRASLAGQVAVVEYMTGADEALALAREIDDPALLVRALAACGFVAVYDAEAARPYLTEAMDLAREIGDLLSLGQILSWLAFIAVIEGEPATTCRAAEEGLDIANAMGNRSVSRQCRVWLGMGLMMKGQLVEAAAEIGLAVSEPAAARDVYTKSIGETARAVVLSFQGDTTAARTAGEAALEAAKSLAGSSYEDAPYAALAFAALAAGDAEAARVASEAAWDSTQRPDFVRRVTSIAESALACGDLDTARRWADDCISISGWWKTRALTTRARISMMRDEPEPAERDAHEALAIAADLGAFLGISDTFECLAAFAYLGESHREAARFLGASDAIRKRMGHIRFKIHDAAYEDLVANVREALGEADFGAAWAEGAALSNEDAIAYAQRGRGERKRPSSGWASLTPTELDVARLVSQGLANKEIAARLFVSPRTVQTDLTHIYTKLGLTSRVQLAQEAARHTLTDTQ
jgi:predicted ATPase/class 3 adenylate cyclase/DNA-binding CsgD family transcriptional regulator